MTVEPLRPLHAIRERRSLRAFADAPLPDEILAVLFEAARWAPSSGNGQPWRFVVVRRGSSSFAALASALRPTNGWAARAPVLVLAAAQLAHVHPVKPPKRNRLALLELGLALGNLLTQATAMGLTAHPMAGFDPTAAGEALDVADGYEVAVLLAIGYPGDPDDLDPEVRAKDQRPRERRPLGETVFDGSWGEPAQFADRDEHPDEGG